jgi:alpha-tubulin suppressor-like RCC1 family protein
MPDSPITNFKDSNNVDLGKKLVTKDYLLEVYGTILENSPASGLVVTPELWTWGVQGEGRLGNNQTSGLANTPVTTTAGGTNWKQVAAGPGSATAAIKTDGTLWVWGDAGSGRLGTNDTTPQRNTPVTTFAGGNDWKQVSCSIGGIHATAIKTDGSLWTWGRNNEGQLGDFSNTQRNAPVTTFIGGTTWKQVSAGDLHTAAIKTDGTLWTWGSAGQGQLGTNDTTPNRNTPVTTFAGGTTWKQVFCGREHTTAIKTDGSLWTWGLNGDGQLGDFSNTQRNAPVTTFIGGTTWKQVSAGDFHTAAIKTDGSLWTWGRNSDYAQLGINIGGGSRNTPVTTFAGGTNWKSVICGGSHTAAIKTDGSLWTWGLNLYGELGNFSTTTRSTPVTTFAGGNNWKQVSGGKNHTAAIQTIDYI